MVEPFLTERVFPEAVRLLDATATEIPAYRHIYAVLKHLCSCSTYTYGVLTPYILAINCEYYLTVVPKLDEMIQGSHCSMGENLLRGRITVM